MMQTPMLVLSLGLLSHDVSFPNSPRSRHMTLFREETRICVPVHTGTRLPSGRKESCDRRFKHSSMERVTAMSILSVPFYALLPLPLLWWISCSFMLCVLHRDSICSLATNSSSLKPPSIHIMQQLVMDVFLLPDDRHACATNSGICTRIFLGKFSEVETSANQFQKRCRFVMSCEVLLKETPRPRLGVQKVASDQHSCSQYRL